MSSDNFPEKSLSLLYFLAPLIRSCHRPHWLIAALIGLASTLGSLGQDADPFGIKPKDHLANKEAAARRYATATQQYQGQPEVLVLPGLLADRRRQKIELWAERSAVVKNAPVEFLLVGEASDHTYEALLISFAKPGDVHRALEFLGFPAGQSFHPGVLRFWPRGESFRVSLARPESAPIPVESLLLDRRSGKALAHTRFLFTGSRRTPANDGAAAETYAADVQQPMSIVSLFNAPHSVLEVAGRAPKEAVYENTTIHPDAPAEGAGLLTVLIEPLNPPEEKRVKDLELRVDQTAGDVAASAPEADRLKSLRCQLVEAGATQSGPVPLPVLLEWMAALDRQKHDFFLTVRFGDRVALGNARAMAGVLAIIDSDRGVRIEPPPIGQLYYRAFQPDRNLLDRDARILHPWELTISEHAGKLTGRLASFQSISKPGRTHADLVVTETRIADPAEFKRAIDAENQKLREQQRSSPPPALMVFVPSTVEHGKLLAFLAPLLPTRPVVHVFVGESPPPYPASGSLP